MTTFSTRRPATTTLLAAAGLLVAAPALTGVAAAADNHPTKAQAEHAELLAAGAGAVTASHPTKAQVEHAEGLAAANERSAADEYVASLLRRHEASKPYNAMEDYVRTLVYWHEHPHWALGH